MYLDSIEWFPRQQNNAGNYAPITGSEVIITSAAQYAFEVGNVVNLQLTAVGDPVPQWETVNTPPGEVIGVAGIPPGLTLSNVGLITGTVGTPTGSYTITVRAWNTFSSATRTIHFSVVAANTGTAPQIVSAEGGNILLGGAVNRQFQATGSPAPTWSFTGQLPPGLTLSPSGQLTGTPTAVGEYTFTIKATNDTGESTRQVTLVVQQVPIIQVASVINIPYSALVNIQLPATGYPAITWNVVGGALPPGISLSASGQLIGTSTVPGTYTVFASATNEAGSVTQPIVLVVEQGGGTGPAPTRSGNFFLLF